MAALMLASLWCWVLIFEGIVSLSRLRRGVRRKPGPAAAPPLLTGVVNAAERSPAAHTGRNAGEVRARISDAMARTARELLTRSEGGCQIRDHRLGSPFVGLFGTVWGIMTSFAAISQAEDTSLATVAPGIAGILRRPPMDWPPPYPPRSATIALARLTRGWDRRWRPSSRSAPLRFSPGPRKSLWRARLEGGRRRPDGPQPAQDR